VLPEADPMNFAPRVKVPVLMINGRYDCVFPLDTCQEPLFHAIAAPAQDTGHMAPSRPLMKDSLNWLNH
jgi:eukaryotic-like serine/threonine-protein kinase